MLLQIYKLADWFPISILFICFLGLFRLRAKHLCFKFLIFQIGLRLLFHFEWFKD